MQLTELMNRAANIGLLIEREAEPEHPGKPYRLTRAVPYNYTSSDYLDGASLDEVAAALGGLEARRHREKAAGIDRLRARAAVLGLELQDTEEPDHEFDEELRGPYVLTCESGYHAHVGGVSLKFIEMQLTQIEAEGQGETT